MMDFIQVQGKLLMGLSSEQQYLIYVIRTFAPLCGNWTVGYSLQGQVKSTRPSIELSQPPGKRVGWDGAVAVEMKGFKMYFRIELPGLPPG